MIEARIKALREFTGTSRRQLEKLTGVPDYTWQAIEAGRQAVKEEHITALAQLWPQYKYWLVFDEICPENGQISPELEETRKKLERAG